MCIKAFPPYILALGGMRHTEGGDNLDYLVGAIKGNNKYTYNYK
jgi:hypothetical protein